MHRAYVSSVLQGRIVNNNTVPAGGGAVAPPNSGTPTTTILTTIATFTYPPTPPSYGYNNHNRSEGAGQGKERHAHLPTQFLIHEEGGLKRWFNLTITNVGLEAVADYTCVAVNAGGVMEKAISLTFEEPEPVSKTTRRGLYFKGCLSDLERPDQVNPTFGASGFANKSLGATFFIKLVV